jgi:uncharacterized protein
MTSNTFNLKYSPGTSDEIRSLAHAFDTYLASVTDCDAAHDLSHLRRVAQSALHIGSHEGANPRVLIAAAYFHDIVNLPKGHPDRHMASSRSAALALEILADQFTQFPTDEYDAVAHAIEAHSFSAAVEPQTIEAKVLQDADRLEALGAIGIARVFYIAGKLGQSLFHSTDPLAESRPLDDRAYAVDHFRVKLLKLHETMVTNTGKAIARENSEYLVDFLAKLVSESKGEMIGLNRHASEFLSLGVPA